MIRCPKCEQMVDEQDYNQEDELCIDCYNEYNDFQEWETERYDREDR
jgi:acetyl-CoA carboxylase beta subunit